MRDFWRNLLGGQASRHGGFQRQSHDMGSGENGFSCVSRQGVRRHHHHHNTIPDNKRTPQLCLTLPPPPPSPCPYKKKGHEGIINCIDGCGGLNVGGGCPEIVTGGRDGCVKVWDVRQKGKPVADISPAEGTEIRDCWAVAFGNSFNDDERCVAAGRFSIARSGL